MKKKELWTRYQEQLDLLSQYLNKQRKLDVDLNNYHQVHIKLTQQLNQTKRERTLAGEREQHLLTQCRTHKAGAKHYQAEMERLVAKQEDHLRIISIHEVKEQELTSYLENLKMEASAKIEKLENTVHEQVKELQQQLSARQALRDSYEHLMKLCTEEFMKAVAEKQAEIVNLKAAMELLTITTKAVTPDKTMEVSYFLERHEHTSQVGAADNDYRTHRIQKSAFRDLVFHLMGASSDVNLDKLAEFIYHTIPDVKKEANGGLAIYNKDLPIMVQIIKDNVKPG